MVKVKSKNGNQKKLCGLVMPISITDGCDESHWIDVKEILSESIKTAGFEAQIVSDADDVGVIQKRIIQNLYENPIVICDISGKNSNVMFELGMRLAFDKPTIIVKDDKTPYTFDTAPIEHLEYPRDLHYARIMKFKAELAKKIKATHKKFLDDGNYTTFLKNFGSFTIPKIETKEVPQDKFVIEELSQIRDELRLITRRSLATHPIRSFVTHSTRQRQILCIHDCSIKMAKEIEELIMQIQEIGVVQLEVKSQEHIHFILGTLSPGVMSRVLLAARRINPKARLL